MNSHCKSHSGSHTKLNTDFLGYFSLASFESFALTIRQKSGCIGVVLCICMIATRPTLASFAARQNGMALFVLMRLVEHAHSQYCWIYKLSLRHRSIVIQQVPFDENNHKRSKFVRFFSTLGIFRSNQINSETLK